MTWANPPRRGPCTSAGWRSPGSDSHAGPTLLGYRRSMINDSDSTHSLPTAPAPPGQPFRYPLRLTIVVFGILIAFGLQSSWQRLTHNHQEHASLIALSEDFRQNLERLDSVEVMLGNVRQAGSELLRIAQGDEDPPSHDSISGLAAVVFMLAGFQPVTSAYDNLINARDLELVRDQELRLALAAFATQVRWLSEVERWQNNQWIFVNQLFLNDRIEVGDLAAHWVSAETRHELPQSISHTDWSALLREQA